MRPALPVAVVLATVSLGVTCSHASRPCPTPRFFAGRPVAHAPDDPATAAAVTATGARYEICSQATDYLIERPGARELTTPELFELGAALEQDRRSFDSVGIGASACPVLGRPRGDPGPGVVLRVRENTASPADIARRVATLADRAGGDPVVRVHVSILSAPGPRCAADDPACGPVPYQAACVERTDYDPKGKRTIVRARPGIGPCTYDGECNAGGCGNECVPTSRIPHAGTCELKGGWENVYCGCVENKCVWFTTR